MYYIMCYCIDRRNRDLRSLLTAALVALAVLDILGKGSPHSAARNNNWSGPVFGSNIFWTFKVFRTKGWFSAFFLNLAEKFWCKFFVNKANMDLLAIILLYECLGKKLLHTYSNYDVIMRVPLLLADILRIASSIVINVHQFTEECNSLS